MIETNSGELDLTPSMPPSLHTYKEWVGQVQNLCSQTGVREPTAQDCRRVLESRKSEKQEKNGNPLAGVILSTLAIPPSDNQPDSTFSVANSLSVVREFLSVNRKASFLKHKCNQDIRSVDPRSKLLRRGGFRLVAQINSFCVRAICRF